MTKTTFFLLTSLALPGVAGATGNEGFLYGTVETDNGNTYRGFLRWGTEEAFWDDHFNSTKDELEYADRLDREERQRHEINIFGVTIGWHSSSGSGRSLIVRYGDLREIEPAGGDRARVTLKNGTVLHLDGGSNDLGATITVQDESLGEVKLKWRNIDRIAFSAAPADVEPPAARLYGTLKTFDQTYTGFIQWDLQECLSTDELDGDTDDGEVSIEMGKIAAIEKRSRRNAYVELWDGRRLLLGGTNDVNSSNDGIFIEDERFGRVEVGWGDFERLEFERIESSGRGYDDYAPARTLRGTVIDTSGRRHVGKIVFDLDESETWEVLDGDLGDVDYHIPFEMIAAIEPRSSDSSYVVLRNGVEIELEDSQDVSDRNDGVVIVPIEGRETYVAWRKVERIELD